VGWFMPRLERQWHGPAQGKGPTLIETKAYRYRGHSRGDPGGYRRKDEHAVWTAQDPIECPPGCQLPAQC
jgi:Dehydrogenase E1 component